MGLYGYVWVCMGINRYVWVYMDIYGYVWVCMGIYRYVWVYMGIYWYTPSPGLHPLQDYTLHRITPSLGLHPTQDYVIVTIFRWSLRCENYYPLGLGPLKPDPSACSVYNTKQLNKFI